MKSLQLPRQSVPDFGIYLAHNTRKKKKKQHKITFFNVLAVIGSTLSEKHSHCFRVRGIAAVNDK